MNPGSPVVPGVPALPGVSMASGNPLLDREAQIKIRRALLAEQARRNAEGLGIAPEGKMVSGHYVAPSIGEHLAKLGQKYVEKRNVEAGEKQIATEEGDLRSQIEAAAEAAFAAGRDTEQPFQAPGIDEADAAAASAGARTIKRGDRAAMARQLSQLPGYQQLGQQVLADEVVNEPVRAEARADRATARAEQRQARIDELNAKLADQKLARAEREQLQRDLAALHAESRREVAQITAGARQPQRDRYQIVTDAAGNSTRVNLDTGEQTPLGAIGKGNAGRPLPHKVVTDLGDMEDRVSTFGRLRTSFAPIADDASGIRGAITSRVGQYAPGGSKSADWWADYRRNSELIERNQLFGASLTQGEKQAWQEASISPAMNKATIERNLAKQEEIYRKAYNRQRERFSKSGYNVQEAFPEMPSPGGARGAGGSWDAPVKVTTKAERDALAPGTRYVGPDGKTAVR